MDFPILFALLGQVAIVLMVYLSLCCCCFSVSGRSRTKRLSSESSFLSVYSSLRYANIGGPGRQILSHVGWFLGSLMFLGMVVKYQEWLFSDMFPSHQGCCVIPHLIVDINCVNGVLVDINGEIRINLYGDHPVARPLLHTDSHTEQSMYRIHTDQLETFSLT